MYTVYVMVHYSYQKRTTKTSETVFYANSANNNFIKTPSQGSH